jgi:hypothetical protein
VRAPTSLPWLTLLAAVLVCASAALTGGTDPTQPVKFLTYLVITAVGLGGCAVTSGATGRPRLCTERLTWPIWAFLVACLLATVLSPAPVSSLVGSPSRFDGLALYGTLGVLVLLAIPCATSTWARRFLLVLAAATALQLVFGGLEMVGLLPDVGAGVEGVKGTLGNPNFYGAFIGMGAAAGAWMVLEQELHVAVRVLGAALVVSCIPMTVLSNAAQGPITAGIALGFVGLAWLLQQQDVRVRRGGFATIGVAVIAGTGLVGAGFTGAGPLAGVADPSSFLLRTYFWRTAVNIGLANPFAGAGLDRYLYVFREYRPIEAVQIESLAARTDAAHNVVLNHFGSGGIPLFLSALAVFGVTTVSAYSLLRSAPRDDLLACGAVVGVWAGYVVQSIVSIDVLPLPIVGWTATALIVGLTLHRRRDSSSPVNNGRGRPNRDRRPGRPLNRPGSQRAAGARIAVGVAVAVALVAGAFAIGTRPLRADRRVAFAMQAEAAGELDLAIAAYEEAASLLPWDPDRASEAGQVHLSAGNGERAEALLLQADARAGGGYFPSTIVLFRIADALGDESEARAHLIRGLELEPRHPDWLAEALTWAETAGDDELVTEITQRLNTVRTGG